MTFVKPLFNFRKHRIKITKDTEYLSPLKVNYNFFINKTKITVLV